MFNNSQKFLPGRQTKLALLGFTLIELLVIIAILGLLASIIVMGLSRAQAQARDGKRKGEVDAIRKALAIYETEQGNYPESSNWIKVEEDAENNGPFSQTLQDYLPEMPKDPLWGQEKEPGKPYSYQYTTGGTGGGGYKIHVEMETGEYASYESYSEGGGEIVYGGEEEGYGTTHTFKATITNTGTIPIYFTVDAFLINQDPVGCFEITDGGFNGHNLCGVMGLEVGDSSDVFVEVTLTGEGGPMAEGEEGLICGYKEEDIYGWWGEASKEFEIPAAEVTDGCQGATATLKMDVLYWQQTGN